MLYPFPGKGKPLGLMAPRSWDSFQTSSMEDDDRESRGFSPRNKADSFESYDSYDEDLDNVYISKTINAPPRPHKPEASIRVGWASLPIRAFYPRGASHQNQGACSHTRGISETRNYSS
jgi:hypothetical protein